jgi:hypothetical protein
MRAGFGRVSVKTYCYFCLNTTEIWMCQLVVVKVSTLEILIKIYNDFLVFYMQTEKNMTYLKKAMDEFWGYLKAKESIRVLKYYVSASKIKVNGMCENFTFCFRNNQ